MCATDVSKINEGYSVLFVLPDIKSICIKRKARDTLI